jgi:hypothetical protein
VEVAYQTGSRMLLAGPEHDPRMGVRLLRLAAKVLTLLLLDRLALSFLLRGFYLNNYFVGLGLLRVCISFLTL